MKANAVEIEKKKKGKKMETSNSVSGRVVDKIFTPTPWTTPAMDSLKLTTQMD